MPSLLAPPQKPHSFCRRVVDRGCGKRTKKLNCSPQTKRDHSRSFTKSLLSLILVLSFFQQSVERSFHFSGSAQNTFGTCSYAYGDNGLLTSRVTHEGMSLIDLSPMALRKASPAALTAKLQAMPSVVPQPMKHATTAMTRVQLEQECAVTYRLS